MGPIKNAYAQHELTVALNGSLVELLVTLLPCMWGYAEIAKRLIKQRPIENENPYKDWLLYYTTDEYKQLGLECMNLIDKLSKKCSKAQIKRLDEYFLMSSYYEVMCWDAYYAKEDWRI
jgi:thiaminase/transcriptional activator TenA